MRVKSKKNQIGFPYALRSFIGYLEGTQKSAHTIKNYRFDILAFQQFMAKNESTPLDQVSQDDLERYRNYLSEKGLKTNTRRRKILTVTQFLSYLAKRNKLPPELARKSPAPHKIERVPYIVSSQTLIDLIRATPVETVLEARNRVLLWTLAEIGCLVSEVTRIRFEDWSASQNPETLASVSLQGKSARVLPVSRALYDAVQELKLKLSPSSAGSPITGITEKTSQWLFHGFNRFGSLGSPMTPRGVELLVKFYGPRLGFPRLTPRTFRHSAVLNWFKQGLLQSEIQARLGLKTAYAFRSYVPLLKSSSETTSNP